MLAKAFVNRLWAHFLGRGFVNPVDDFGTHNPSSHPELLSKLGEEFKKSGYDVKKLCRWIMASRAYQLSSIGVKAKGGDKDEGLFAQMQLKPMSPEQLFDSLLTASMAHHTGGSREDSDRRRQMWLQQFIFTFANDEDGESSSFQGTIPQALDDDERRAHGNGGLLQTGEFPLRIDGAGAVVRESRRTPSWLNPSILLPSVDIRRPKSSPELATTLETIRTASRSFKTCSGLCSIPTNLCSFTRFPASDRAEYSRPTRQGLDPP